MSVTAIIDPQVVAGRNYPLLARSPLLRRDYNRGIKWAFDLSHEYCYNGGSPVANDASILNMAEVFSERANPVPAGSAVIANTVTHSGGGFDWSAITTHGNYVQGPTTPAAAIWANNQYFLSATLLKLPTAADWPEGVAVYPISTWNVGANGYAANPDIATIGMQMSGVTPILSMIRQIDYSSAIFSSVGLAPPTAALGGFAMIGGWRTSTEMGLRLTTSLGTVLATPAATGANNGVDCSGLRPYRGIAGPLWTPQIALNGHKWKLYAGFDDAAGLDGRNVHTILDQLWAIGKAKWDAGTYT